MATQQQRMYLTHLPMLLRFIQLHHLQQWLSWLMNGARRGKKISLDSKSKLLNCNLKVVQQVRFMVRWQPAL